MIRDKVSIVIVTCNSLPAIRDCLASLPEPGSGLDYEVLVVDNFSSDGSLAAVREFRPDAAIIANEANLGFAAACNAGAEKAGGEFILFLNPDMILDAGAIECLVASQRRSPKVGAVSGRIRFPDGSFQPTCRNFPTVCNMIVSRGSFLSRIIGGGRLYTLPDYGETTEVPSMAATMMLLRARAFSRVGRFDERFFMYMEDTDQCLRLERAGFRNLFVPQAGGVHAWGTGSDAGSRRRAWYHHNSVWRYFLKHLPNLFSLLLLPALLTMNLLFVTLFPGLSSSKGGKGQAEQ